MGELLFLSLFPILILSSIWDILKNKKIPNAFLIVGLVLGMVYSYVVEGWQGVLISLLSVFIIFVFGFFILWGIMAAGDVKLLMIISTYVGVTATFKILLITLVLSTVLFIVVKPIRFVNSLRMVTNFVFYTIPIRVYDKKQSIAFAPYITLSFIFFYLMFL